MPDHNTQLKKHNVIGTGEALCETPLCSLPSHHFTLSTPLNLVFVIPICFFMVLSIYMYL